MTQLTHRFSEQTGVMNATQRAYGQIYGTIQRQAAVLAYVDTFWLLMALCLLPLGLLFFAKKPKPGQVAMGH